MQKSLSLQPHRNFSIHRFSFRAYFDSVNSNLSGLNPISVFTTCQKHIASSEFSSNRLQRFQFPTLNSIHLPFKYLSNHFPQGIPSSLCHLIIIQPPVSKINNGVTQTMKMLFESKENSDIVTENNKFYYYNNNDDYVRTTIKRKTTIKKQ
jgi:hypothetical protein